jgi:hypothetical protein
MDVIPTSATAATIVTVAKTRKANHVVKRGERPEVVSPVSELVVTSIVMMLLMVRCDGARRSQIDPLHNERKVGGSREPVVPGPSKMRCAEFSESVSAHHNDHSSHGGGMMEERLEGFNDCHRNVKNMTSFDHHDGRANNRRRFLLS